MAGKWVSIESGLGSGRKMRMRGSRLNSGGQDDYIDRVGDNLQKVERNYSEGFFVWLLYNPKILETWSGVDVLNVMPYWE
jgi:hypothetical protein